MTTDHRTMEESSKDQMNERSTNTSESLTVDKLKSQADSLFHQKEKEVAIHVSKNAPELQSDSAIIELAMGNRLGDSMTSLYTAIDDLTTHPVEIEPNDEDDIYYYVKKIWAHTWRDGTSYYLIQWTGFNQATWEPEENCEECQEAIRDFQQRERRRLKNIIRHMLGIGLEVIPFN